MRLLLLLKLLVTITLLSSASTAATTFPKKFDGLCKEVGTNRKQKSKVGIDFKEFPQAIELIQSDSSILRALLNQPTRTAPNQDRYVLLEKVTEDNSTQFTLRYYGTMYADGPYFYEMTVDYTLDKDDRLTTHQLQTTYYQGKVSQMNEWICTYKRYRPKL